MNIFLYLSLKLKTNFSTPYSLHAVQRNSKRYQHSFSFIAWFGNLVIMSEREWCKTHWTYLLLFSKALEFYWYLVYMRHTKNVRYDDHASFSRNYFKLVYSYSETPAIQKVNNSSDEQFCSVYSISIDIHKNSNAEMLFLLRYYRI